MSEQGKKSAPQASNPTIFISCVSSEFRTARLKVAESLRFLGYDVEYQENFPTDAGDLRDLLKKKIDRCEGLVQIIGDAYGAEPPSIDSEFGRVSYTQFELLYARSQGKKTWLLFAGPDSVRDAAPESLDLPDDGDDSARQAQQRARQTLQAAYRESLQEGDLWWEFGDETDLENRVLRLRRDLDELRREYRRWQESLQAQQHKVGHRLRNIMLAVAALALLIVGSFYSLRGGLESLDIAPRKEKTAELVIEDVYFATNVMLQEHLNVPGLSNMFLMNIGPANEGVTFLFKTSTFDVEAVDGEMNNFKEMDLGVNTTEHVAYTFESDSPPTRLRVTVHGADGDSAGPFTFDTRYVEKLAEERGDARNKALETATRKLTSGRNLLGMGAFICSTHRHSAALMDCVTTGRQFDDLRNAGVNRIEFGADAGTLPMVVDFPPEKGQNDIAYSTGGRRSSHHFIFPANVDTIYYRLNYSDGGTSDVWSITVESYGRQNTYDLENSPAYELMAADSTAPRVFVSPAQLDFNKGGEWSFVPLVGDEVVGITWSIFEGGGNSIGKDEGYFAATRIDGDEIGVLSYKRGKPAPPIGFEYRYADGTAEQFVYTAAWQSWVEQSLVANVRYDDLVRCTRNALLTGPDGRPILPVSCQIDADQPLGEMFQRIETGTSPSTLAAVTAPDVDAAMAAYEAAWDDHLATQKALPEGERKHSIARLENLRSSQTAMMRRRLEQNLPSWESAAQKRMATIATVSEDVDAMFFRFTLVDGSQSQVVRVPVR